MQITHATVSDIEVLVPLFDAYRIFYKQNSNLIGARDFLLRRLQNSDSAIFIAKLEDGSGVGFVQLYPSFSSIGMRTTWILNDLFVAVEHRSKGVGEKLIAKATHFARETGAKTLMLQTALDNYGAQKTVFSFGMVEGREISNVQISFVGCSLK